MRHNQLCVCVCHRRGGSGREKAKPHNEKRVRRVHQGITIPSDIPLLNNTRDGEGERKWAHNNPGLGTSPQICEKEKPFDCYYDDWIFTFAYLFLNLKK